MSKAIITIVGQIGKDGELGTSSTTMLKFSVAVSRGVKGKDGKWINETDWFNCVLFGKLAESFSDKIVKGNKVFISGEFKTNSYQDKQGVKQTQLQVIVNQIEILDKVAVKSADPMAKLTVNLSDEDIPF